MTAHHHKTGAADVASQKRNSISKPERVATGSGHGVIFVRQTGSATGNKNKEKIKRTLVGLHLGRIGKRSVLENSPSIAGMIRKTEHLVEYEVVLEQSLPGASRRFLNWRATRDRPLAALKGVFVSKSVQCRPVLRYFGTEQVRLVRQRIERGTLHERLTAIEEAAQMLRVHTYDKSMALEDTYAARRVTATSLVPQLYRKLFSSNPEEGRAAALALVASLPDANPEFRRIRTALQLNGSLEKALSEALVKLLLETGDQFYSSVIINAARHAAGAFTIAATAEVTRALPFELAGARPTLPLQSKEDRSIAGDARILIDPPAIDVAVMPRADGPGHTSASLYFAKLHFTLSEDQMKRNHIVITLLIPGLICEPYTFQTSDILALSQGHQLEA